MKFLYYTALLCTFSLFQGCGNYNDVDKTPSIVGELIDNQEWYNEMPQTLLETRVFIPVPNDDLCVPWDDLNASPRPCTFDDVWHDTDSTDDYEPRLHVHYENDEYMENSGVNADFIQKGKTTRHAKLKSFRIKLDKGEPFFYKERTMQLNKHPFDRAKMRNKLYFEIFQDIPNFNSLRTRFAHLYIDIDGNLTDQGLFTHIEKCDKYYLQNRGYSEDDNLYKTQNFAFRITPEMKLNEKGDPVDPDAFDSVITIVNGKETYKLLEMLQAVDDAKTDESFMKVFNQYFNRENYITWMAVNIVSGNKDTITQNFFLLNPHFSDKFYFLPWDYDGAGRALEKYAKWEWGIGTWWGITLHKKFLKIKQNRDDLDKMVYNIRNNYISDEVIHEKLDRFRVIVEPFMKKEPDVTALPYEDWEEAFYILRDEMVPLNMREYESQKGVPMPFWQSAQYFRDTQTLHVTWDESVDLEGDEVLYNLEIATFDDVNFTNPFIVENNISKTDPRIQYESWGNFIYDTNISLEPGHYYMKVISFEKNNPEHYQIAFDKEVEIDGVKYFGVLEFKVD